MFRGKYVLNFRSISFFLRSEFLVQTNKKGVPVLVSVRLFLRTKSGKKRLRISHIARFQVNTAAFRLVLEVTFIENKAIEEMCEKST